MRLIVNLGIAPAIYLVAGVLVSARRYGNTDAAAWRRIGVALAWPLFLRDFRG